MLEHFRDPVDRAAQLLDHCDTLHVMVPFKERIRADGLAQSGGVEHVYGFTRHSFDALVAAGVARGGIGTCICRCPGAWGATMGESLRSTIPHFGRPKRMCAAWRAYTAHRQIIYTINGKGDLPQCPKS